MDRALRGDQFALALTCLPNEQSRGLKSNVGSWIGHYPSLAGLDDCPDGNVAFFNRWKRRLTRPRTLKRDTGQLIASTTKQWEVKGTVVLNEDWFDGPECSLRDEAIWSSSAMLRDRHDDVFQSVYCYVLGQFSFEARRVSLLEVLRPSTNNFTHSRSQNRPRACQYCLRRVHNTLIDHPGPCLVKIRFTWPALTATRLALFISLLRAPWKPW